MSWRLRHHVVSVLIGLSVPVYACGYGIAVTTPSPAPSSTSAFVSRTPAVQLQGASQSPHISAATAPPAAQVARTPAFTLVPPILTLAPIVPAPTFALRPPPTLPPTMKPVPLLPPAAQTYLWPGGGHWVSSTIDSGRYILLEDRSLWEIDSLDRIATTLWLTIDSITVVESNGCLYGYRLINTNDRTTTCARFVSYSR